MFFTTETGQGRWLSDLDSNQDKGLQRALCYRYTIGQTESKIALRAAWRKANFGERPPVPIERGAVSGSVLSVNIGSRTPLRIGRLISILLTPNFKTAGGGLI